MYSAHPAPLFCGATSCSHETVNFSRIQPWILLTSALLGKIHKNHKWFAQTWTHLGRLGGTFPSKSKVILSNKTPQSLRSHSCLQPLQRGNNGGLMTALSGWVCAKTKDRCHCQSTIVWGACVELYNSAKNMWMAWYEKGVWIYWDLKKRTGRIFIVIGWFYTHTAKKTHFSSNNM